MLPSGNKSLHIIIQRRRGRRRWVARREGPLQYEEGYSAVITNYTTQTSYFLSSRIEYINMCLGWYLWFSTRALIYYRMLNLEHVRWLISGLIRSAGAGLLWEKNTVGWLISPGWNQQTNRLLIWSITPKPPHIYETYSFYLQLLFLNYIAILSMIHVYWHMLLWMKR